MAKKTGVEGLPPGVTKCKGVNGTIIFDGIWVTIDRTKGVFTRGTVGKGEKKIALTQITSVRWKQATALIRGYISFSLPGGNETRSRFGNQTKDAVNDENAVIVAHSQADEFLALRPGSRRRSVRTTHLLRHPPLRRPWTIPPNS